MKVDVAGREGIADEEIVGLGGVVVLAVLEVRILRRRQRQLDRLRHHLPFERGEGDFDRDRHLRRPRPARRAFQALIGVFGAEFAEAVLGLAAERRERLFGVHDGLHDAGVAALGGVAVEMLLHSDCVGGHLLRGRVVPFAVDFDDVPLLAGLIQRLVDAVVTVAVDGSAGDAAHFEDLAAIGQMLVEPLRPIDPEALLVDIDVDRVFAIENIVERHQNDACVIGSLDDGLERRRILSVDDDRVEAGIDEIIDCCDLRGDVLAGRDDLELLELGRNVGLRGEGLGGLDHLNAPGVGDEAVGERDAERPFLCGPLEELGLVGPRHEAVRLGGRAGDDFRAGGEGGRREGARGGQHGAADGGDGELAETIHPCPPFCASIGRPHRSLVTVERRSSCRSSPPPPRNRGRRA